jgi:hypothetical protein
MSDPVTGCKEQAVCQFTKAAFVRKIAARPVRAYKTRREISRTRE